MVIGQSKKEIAAERDSILSEFHISAGEPVFYEEPLLEFSKELKG
jgi:biotin carboxyl carrier protein